MSSADFDLERFFGQATRAVVDTQHRLDREVNPAAVSGSRRGQRFFYSLPRASFVLESEIDFSKKGRLLRRSKEAKTTLSHRVGFELIAAPEPPPPPRGKPSIELIEPAILAPDAEEDRLARDLIEALDSGVAGASREWWFVDQANTRSLIEREDTDQKIRAEAVWVEQAWKAPGQKNPKAPGGTNGRLVFFRLSGGRVLAARIVGSGKQKEKGKRDGLFVIHPEGTPKVVIYTFPGDPWPRKVSYEPLHLLARNVRLWLAGELADQHSTWRPSGGRGFKDLDDFLETLQEVIHDRLTDLADQTDPFAGAEADAVIPRALPSYYQLAETRARLRFSVETETGKVSFREMLFGGGDDDSPVPEAGASGPPPETKEQAGEDETADATIANQVVIRAEQLQGRTEITVRLADLEFLPRAEAREALLELVVNDKNSETVAQEMGDRERYAVLLADPALRQGAVVFRSRSPKPGKIAEELVVVWPAGGDPARDFVFSCTKKGSEIDAVQKVMGLEDNVGDVHLDLRQFGPFHRFLAAVSLWSHRGKTS